MSGSIHQMSDKFFKKSLSNPKVAKEFFETHLPSYLKKLIDLETLVLQKESFIDEHFRASSADILYQAKCGDSDAYLYLLCEHQSKPDRLMAFRLLNYTVRIIERHLKSHASSPLPIVHPIVMYTGEAPWRAPADIYTLYGNNEALARETLFKPYQLVDIHRVDDAKVKETLLAGIFQFVFKYQKMRNLIELFESLCPWLEAIQMQGELAYFKDVLYFIFHETREHPDASRIFDITLWQSEPVRREVMSLADFFREEGLRSGIEQGIEQGIVAGESRSRKSIAVNLINMGMRSEDIAKALNISPAELQTLISEISHTV